ncbi:hypothetical protein M3223_20495 [Paenibacillus pasadenensis]|uniref:hypothetical protein n=1 Tax=Paenibacillus pasadenensis TaxID=217090 RepID=UPI002040015A|nr:hypothetical protein [Paenibacillus pasadenensis]MCM3749736.1 hypothetical protein [Paenibacillus pasadenensis]
MQVEYAIEFPRIFAITERFIDVFSIMLLLGIFYFRSCLWPVVQAKVELRTIIRLERIAAAAVLYAAILSGGFDWISITKVIVGAVWLVIAFERSESSFRIASVKIFLSIILITTVAAGNNRELGGFENIAPLIIAAMSFCGQLIWLGGGLGLWLSAQNHAGLATVQLKSLTDRFMSWALFSLLFILFPELIALLQGEFSPIRLFIPLVIAGMVYVYSRSKDIIKPGILHLNILLLIFLIAHASILSVSSPSREAEPFYWHVMGTEAHMSLRIIPQTEQARLDAWLPTGMGKPAEAAVELSKEGAKVQLPFSFKEGGPDPFGYEGFDKYTYLASGEYLDSPGIWTLSVTVKDSKGRVHVFKKKQFVN